MMIDRAARSARNYEVKLRLGACGRLSEEEIQRRVGGYTCRAYEQQAVNVQVRQALCSQGVVSTWFPMYHAYARELGKLKRLDSPEARFEALRATAAKWTARGLSAAALREIAESVFNLPWPASADKSWT
jgi:hypothetical protein